MILQSDRVVIIPMTSDDKNAFYELATQSYGSQFWYDAVRKATRTKEQFFHDWHDGYFDEFQPLVGQCFWIIVNEERIGQINYNAIDSVNKTVELDIIIGLKEYLGKGYGTDAIQCLVKYLFETFDLKLIWIEARSNNPRAIKAYEKAGFTLTKVIKNKVQFNGEWVDGVRMEIPRIG